MAGYMTYFTSCLFILLQLVAAQFGPDDRWNNPDGSKVDFTSIFTAGDTITLSWRALNQSQSDLWLTHWDSTNYPWHDQVATNVDISVAGTLKWRINVPSNTILTDNRFVLRFYPRNAPYIVMQIPQNASPGFLLVAAPTSSQSTQTSATATSSSSSSTSALSSTSASGSSSTSTSTSTPAPSSNNSLSIGAQAGIGVAVGIAVIALFIAGCFFGRRYGIGRTLRHKDSGSDREHFPMTLKHGLPNAAEADGTEKRYYDAPQMSNTTESASLIANGAGSEDSRSWHKDGSSRVEMGGNSLHPVEKSGAMVRPGVHELG